MAAPIPTQYLKPWFASFAYLVFAKTASRWAGGGGQGATAYPPVGMNMVPVKRGKASRVLPCGGGVASVTVTAGGAGYATPPTVTAVNPAGFNGIPATFTAVLTANAVTSIIVDNPGFGYATPPTLNFAGGGGAGANGTPVLQTGWNLGTPNPSV